jgi:hypothetical protein
MLSDHGIVQAELMLVLGPLARVPDGSFFRSRPGTLLSPDDETWEKVDFYAAQGVQEILVAHPEERWVLCYDLQADPSAAVLRSRVLDISRDEVVAQVDWPA